MRSPSSWILANGNAFCKLGLGIYLYSSVYTLLEDKARCAFWLALMIIGCVTLNPLCVLTREEQNQIHWKYLFLILPDSLSWTAGFQCNVQLRVRGKGGVGENDQK